MKIQFINLRPTKMVLAAMMTAASFNLTACSKTDMNNLKEKLGIEKAEEKQISKVTVSDQMDSEQLALAAEQLMSPYTFMLANKAAEMALQKDSSNLRAQFYKLFTDQFMVFKGVMTRIKPFTRAHGNISQLEDSINKIPRSPLHDFLVNGDENISSSEQILDVVVAYRKAVNEFRKFLRRNPDMFLEINLNPHVWEKALESSIPEYCSITKVKTKDGSQQYESVCDFNEIAVRKINAADALVMSQYSAGQVLYYSLLTSYSIEGVEKYIAAKPETMNAVQRQNFLESLPQFGKLRADQGITDILSLGSDTLAAVRWVQNQQQSLCPKGVGVNNQRKGFLFSTGICISDQDETSRSMALLEQALQGVVHVELETSTGEKAPTAIDAFAWSRKPVVDLRSIAPAAYNECGDVTRVRDNTYGGIYVNGDANLFLSKSCNK